MDNWYYISLSYATYAIQVKNEHVIKAPPIGKWMIGKHWSEVERWLNGKNAYIEIMSKSKA